jgi:GAF domain-containing protein
VRWRSRRIPVCSAEFLEYFAVVDDDHAACGRAARTGAQAVIVDVDTDPGFAPHRGIAAATGFRSVQSTPLVDYSGRLIGMVSTHFRRPHRPPDRDLQILQGYGDVAGEAIAGHLGAIPVDDHDGIGRALVTALLDPRQAWQAALRCPAGTNDPGTRPGGYCAIVVAAGLPPAWWPGLAAITHSPVWPAAQARWRARAALGESK